MCSVLQSLEKTFALETHCCSVWKEYTYETFEFSREITCSRARLVLQKFVIERVHVSITGLRLNAMHASVTC